MKFEDEKARGNISDSTTLEGDGEYVGYASVNYGPWIIEFTRAVEREYYHESTDETVTAKGPFIKDERPLVVTTSLWDKITESIDSWDYVERTDNEIYEHTTE